MKAEGSKRVMRGEKRANAVEGAADGEGPGPAHSGRGLHQVLEVWNSLEGFTDLSSVNVNLTWFISTYNTSASMTLISSVRSEDRKEVFLAIQVDGVTRARTAPLALRGPALSLNHAFHLELERAQLLRMVLLTPGEGH